MEYYQNFIKNEKLRRWVVLAFLIAVLYFVRSILPLMLLTFVFSYLAYRFVSFIERKIKLPGKISGFILYGVILFLIYLGITEYIPVLVNQLTHLINAVSKFYQNNSNGESALMDSIYNLFKEYNLADKLQSSLGTLVDYVTSFGKGLLIVVFAFLMSFFFTIDRK